MSIFLTGNKFVYFFILFAVGSFFSPTQAQQSRKTPVISKVSFEAGNAARSIPFELHDNHIYLLVRINDSAPLRFILDTGASSVINRAAAESLNLKFRGRKQGFGVGEKAVEASFVEGVSIKISGATLVGQKLAAVALEDLQKSLGHPVDGILGYEFLSRVVVEIDYAAKIINLYAAPSYRYKGAGDRIPLIVDAESSLIFARALLKPQNRPPLRGLFEIDSGGGHALILNSSFVRRNRLLAVNQKEMVVSLGGISGSSQAVAGTVETLQLGRRQIAGVSTFFSLATSGMLASEEFDGNIGNDFLRHFKVVFDYSRRSMILEPID